MRPSGDGVKHNATVLLSHHGSEATPEYSLRHPDPTLPGSKNRYALALYDSYNPEILFGEVLLVPEWTQKNPSEEEIRLNGGIPPPPLPVLPTEFVIQLYNPDQQVIVKLHAGSIISAAYWEFEMPQRSFRQPSNSTLDRTKSDPTASETTPKISFKWKKDGKLSKDYVCALSGKSTNPDGSKRKHREPDITVALFRQLREITIYEPNLYRVDMEDAKGLEVVLLLGAIVIREVFNSPLKDVFNIADIPKVDSNEGTSRNNSGNKRSTGTSDHSVMAPAPQISPNLQNSQQGPHTQSPIPSARLPPTDPRTQWEIDAETARLKKQVEHEEQARRRAEHAETKRIKKMIEAEEREARRKQAEIDKETERLKKIYSVESMPNSNPPARPHHGRLPRHSNQQPQNPRLRSQSAVPWAPVRSNMPQGSPSIYTQGPRNGATSEFFSGSSPNDEGKKVKAKKSFFGIRSFSDESPKRLTKKQSAVW